MQDRRRQHDGGRHAALGVALELDEDAGRLEVEPEEPMAEAPIAEARRCSA